MIFAATDVCIEFRNSNLSFWVVCYLALQQVRQAVIVIRIRQQSMFVWEFCYLALQQVRQAVIAIRIRSKASIFVRKTLQVLPCEIKKALAF